MKRRVSATATAKQWDSKFGNTVKGRYCNDASFAYNRAYSVTLPNSVEPVTHVFEVTNIKSATYFVCATLCLGRIVSLYRNRDFAEQWRSGVDLYIERDLLQVTLPYDVKGGREFTFHQDYLFTVVNKLIQGKQAFEKWMEKELYI
jgi:hypothetical protein